MASSQAPAEGDAAPVPCFRLSFRPNTALVSTVRRFVAEFYQRWLSADLTSQVALATHELLENAVVHSCNGETEVHIEITPQDPGQRVCIRTRNAASPADLEVLRTAFVELHDAATDPDAYYQSVLWRNAKRTDGSGLGLARILAETGMTMSLDITDDKVCICATMNTQATQATQEAQA